MLEDRVDVAPIRRDAGDRLTGQQDLALGRLLEARDHPQRRRLAAARRAEEASRTRPRSMRRFMWSTAVTVAEPLRDIDDLDVGSRAARRRPRASRRTVGRRRGAGAASGVREAVNGGPRGRTIRALSDVPVALLQVARWYGRDAHASTHDRCESRTSRVGDPRQDRPRLNLYFSCLNDPDGDRRHDMDTDVRLGARIRALRQARRLTLARSPTGPGSPRASSRRSSATSPARPSPRSSGSRGPSTSRSPSCSPRSRRAAGSSGARRAGASRTRGSRRSTNS